MALLAKEVTRVNIVTLPVLLSQAIRTDNDAAALDILLSRGKLSGLQNLGTLFFFKPDIFLKVHAYDK